MHISGFVLFFLSLFHDAKFCDVLQHVLGKIKVSCK